MAPYRHMLTRTRWVIFFLVPTLAGLVFIAQGCNPVFVNQLTGGSVTPLAPGDQAHVLFHVVNDTDFDIDVYYGVDAPAWSAAPGLHFFRPVQAGTERGVVIPCPVNEIGLGSLTDPAQAALDFTVPEGGKISVPASAFPFTLVNGVDYVCGDAVLITIINARNSPFMVTVVPSRIAGSTQTGPFSGPDTFANLDRFLQLTTQLPVPAN